MSLIYSVSPINVRPLKVQLAHMALILLMQHLLSRVSTTDLAWRMLQQQHSTSSKVIENFINNIFVLMKYGFYFLIILSSVFSNSKIENDFVSICSSKCTCCFKHLRLKKMTNCFFSLLFCCKVKLFYIFPNFLNVKSSFLFFFCCRCWELLNFNRHYDNRSFCCT